MAAIVRVVSIPGDKLGHHEVDLSQNKTPECKGTLGTMFWLVVNLMAYGAQVVTSLFPLRTYGSFEGYFYFWFCDCHDNTPFPSFL